MNTYIRSIVIGTATALVVTTVLFKSSQAATLNQEEDSKLEQMVQRNEACRLIVFGYQSGAVRLYFENKDLAEAAVNRLYDQNDTLNLPKQTIRIYSPDCDIDVRDR